MERCGRGLGSGGGCEGEEGLHCPDWTDSRSVGSECTQSAPPVIQSSGAINQGGANRGGGLCKETLQIKLPEDCNGQKTQERRTLEITDRCPGGGEVPAWETQTTRLCKLTHVTVKTGADEPVEDHRMLKNDGARLL